jgi:sugar O-acyltransferase (sialic acid O-acetyltransferase NeuD family)
MSALQQIILVGAFIEIVELCDAIGVEIIGIIDNEQKDSFLGRPILGTDEDANDIIRRWPGIPVHVTPDSPKLRRRLSAEYSRLGADFATLVHPAAHLSPSALIGPGSVIQAGAHVSSASRLGCGVKVNTCANITHDVIVGDFATVAPAAVLLGRTNIGSGAYIGANATILPGITIGNEAIVGAGTTVTRDVPAGSKVAGVPGKPL